MPEHPKAVTLDTVANGAAPDYFRVLFPKILEDVSDPNKDPGAKRVLTLTFTFAGIPDRSAVTGTCSASWKPAVAKGPGALHYLGADEDGNPIATLFDQRQTELPLDPTPPDIQPPHREAAP